MFSQLKNLSVGVKVLSIVSLCLFALAGVAGFSIFQMNKIGGEIEAIAEQDIPLTEILTKITVHQLEQAINVERAARFGEAMAHDSHAAEQFEKAVTTFEALAHQVDVEIKQGEAIAEEAAAHAISAEAAQEFEHVLGALTKIEAEHAVFDEHALEVFSLLSQGYVQEAIEKEAVIEAEVEALDHELEALLGEISAFTAQATSRVEQAEQFALMLMVAISVGSIVVALGLAWLMVKLVIGRPLRELVAALESLIAGNTDISLVPRAEDEIGKVAQALGVFRERLIENKRLEAEAEEQKATAERERKEALMAMADNLEGSVGSIVQAVSAAATEMQSSAEAMAATAEQTNSQAAAVSAASEETTTNVSTVASATEELSSSISEITRQVAQSSTITSRAVDQAEQTMRTVQGMVDMAEKVGEVVNLINDIAEQTNLLALNATIEAARAGEAGKGFAVVASEVKNLASQTARATEEISSQVAGMQNETTETTKAIESISAIIGEVNEIATGIAAAVEEQGSATSEISRNVQEAAQGTQEVASNIAGVSQAAGESGQAAAQVLETAGELASQSNMLSHEVNKFLAEVRAA